MIVSFDACVYNGVFSYQFKVTAHITPMYLLLKIISKMPFWALYILAYLIYFIVFYVVRYRRTIVFTHLNTAFPDKSKSEIKVIAKAYYRNIADVTVETIKSSHMSIQDIMSRITYKNPELLTPLIASGKSFILLAAHSCNWEWLMLASDGKLPVSMVTVYKPLHGQGANKFIFESRSRFGVEMVDLKNFASEVMKNKRKQYAYSLLADQKPMNSGKYHTTQFLNQETRFFIGPEKIAQFIKASIVYAKMVRTSKGHYEVEYSLLAEPPYKKIKGEYPVTELYVRALEQQIFEQPESWLWSNRRWRKRSAERTAKK